MLLHILKVSIRNIAKNRVYSLINVIGLALAFTCAVLVTLFIKDELSYDRFHEHSSHLYRLTTTITKKDGSQEKLGSTGQIQGPAFKAALPEVANYVRLMSAGFNVGGETKTLGLKGLFADQSFFKIFSFPLSDGNLQTAFNDPDAIVLTETTAKKFFGRTNVIGSVLTVEQGSYSRPFTVKAVAKDPPLNSSVQFGILVPFSYLEESWTDTDWLNQYLSTFILLHPQADPTNVEKKFNEVFESVAKDQLLKVQKNEGYLPKRNFQLQPITDIHLNRNGLEQEQAGSNSTGIDAGSLTYSYILSGIVVFILVMACINFVNLSIGNSLRRAKEIGVRKINGSSKGLIIVQFLFEALIVSIAALFLAVVTSQFLLPVFNSLTGKQLDIDVLLSPELVAIGCIVLSLTVLLAGLYPAFILSRFNAKEVLYNKIRLNTGHWFGKSLVVLQFSLAIVLMVATIVYYRQMEFMSAKDLGYDQRDIIRVFVPADKPKHVVERLKLELANHSSVIQVATGSDNNGAVLGGFPTSINNREFKFVNSQADNDLLQMLKIPLVEGRYFSKNFINDKSQAVIVNESFVKAAGLKTAVGHQFKNTWGAGELRTIVGVVKDYHYSSLKDKIQPQAIFMTDDLPFFWVKVQQGKNAEAVSLLERKFKQVVPAYPLQFSVLADENEALYANEKHWQQIINYSAVLSILICCIGLFGLAHLATAQRWKEIGIRKVLGASVINIVSILSKDIVKLVCAAAVLGFPVAWLAMNRWLEDFAYRINLSIWLFVLAGIASVMIAIITVSSQAIKAAVANPVKSLRSE